MYECGFDEIVIENVFVERFVVGKIWECVVVDKWLYVDDSVVFLVVVVVLLLIIKVCEKDWVI